MSNQDLYKQAIAEAKSIRETAITNARLALEESLTPHLKELLAQKLQEMEDETAVAPVSEVSPEDEELGDMSDYFFDIDTPEEELSEAKEDTEEDAEESDEEEAEEKAEEETEEEIEIEDMTVEDLKNLIRDILSQEMGQQDLMGDMEADMEQEPAMDMVGAGDEEIDLDELLAELAEMSTEEDSIEEENPYVEEELDELRKKKATPTLSTAMHKAAQGKDLKEALSTISTLRKELNEVNLLNAKLLYVNKIFKSTNLDESQKVRIITAFDKAETVKEAKLVYESVTSSIVTKKSQAPVVKEHKSFASKSIGTAPKKQVISEASEAVKRMQKLAGIIK
jgi:hypothetical protein